MWPAAVLHNQNCPVENEHCPTVKHSQRSVITAGGKRSYSDDDSSKLLALQLTAKPLEALGTQYIQSTASCMIQPFVACRYSP